MNRRTEGCYGGRVPAAPDLSLPTSKRGQAPPGTHAPREGAVAVTNVPAWTYRCHRHPGTRTPAGVARSGDVSSASL
jgi:hypothetical protein